MIFTGLSRFAYTVLSFFVILNLCLFVIGGGGRPSLAEGLKTGYLDQLKPAAGYSLHVLASGLPGARLMALTRQGDVIVSLSGRGDVVLLPMGQPNEKMKPLKLLSGLDRPHGLAVDGEFLYVAEETEVSRYQFDGVKRKITGDKIVMFDGMPAGGHSTRTIAKGPDGSFYVSVGSSCNVCVERHPWRAALLKFKPGKKPVVFARGLRNTVGYDWHPRSGALYGVDNGRDWLGDDLPPGEVNLISDGGFYGWPYFYGANVRDTQFGGAYSPAKHGKPIAPAHEFAAHVAPLSLKFTRKLKDQGHAAALVSQHGSWNRSTPIGYKVVRLDFDETGRIKQSDFLSGFLQNGGPIGRPVDSLELADGSILISDDLRGAILLMRPLL